MSEELKVYYEVFVKAWLMFKQAYELYEQGALSEQAWISLLDCAEKIGAQSDNATRLMVTVIDMVTHL